VGNSRRRSFSSDIPSHYFPNMSPILSADVYYTFIKQCCLEKTDVFTCWTDEILALANESKSPAF